MLELGYKFTNNRGIEFEVISVVRDSGRKKYLVKSTLSGYEKVVPKFVIDTGSLLDRLAPYTAGVGYIGETGNSRNNRKEYDVWNSMLCRCYDASNAGYKFYGGKGVRVNNRWHNFSNFLEDITKIRGYDDRLYCSGLLELDKDYLQRGVPINEREYSVSTCVFVSKSENINLSNSTMPKKKVVAISPENDEFIVEGIREFCRDKGLDRGNVLHVLRGDTKTHKGWKFKHIETSA